MVRNVVATALGLEGPEPLGVGAGVGPACGGASPVAALAGRLAASHAMITNEAIKPISLMADIRKRSSMRPPERINGTTVGLVGFATGSIRRDDGIFNLCRRHCSMNFPVIANNRPARCCLRLGRRLMVMQTKTADELFPHLPSVLRSNFALCTALRRCRRTRYRQGRADGGRGGGGRRRGRDRCWLDGQCIEQHLHIALHAAADQIDFRVADMLGIVVG